MALLSIKARFKPNDIAQRIFIIGDERAKKIVSSLAERCEASIKMWILNTSKMPTGALADAFFKEQLGKYSWGIGNIEYLNKTTSYWRHVNFGSQAIGANWEHILPKGHWQDGRWIEGDSDDDFFAVPNTPIQPHNYIEKTLVDLELAIQLVLKEGA